MQASKTKTGTGHRVARLYMSYNHMMFYDQQGAVNAGQQYVPRPSVESKSVEIEKPDNEERDCSEGIQERIVPGAFDIVGRGDFPAINVFRDRIWVGKSATIEV